MFSLGLSRCGWLIILIVGRSSGLLLLLCGRSSSGSGLVGLLLLCWDVLLWLGDWGWLLAVDLECLGLSEDGVVESSDVGELVEERSVDDLFISSSSISTVSCCRICTIL